MRAQLFFIVFFMSFATVFVGAKGTPEESPSGAEWFELWNSDNRFGERVQDHPQNPDLLEQLNTGLYGPMVGWGTEFTQALQLRIAAGEVPDLFNPPDGMEAKLAEQGALMDLTDLLPRYAPNIWSAIPDRTWDYVRLNAEDGRIYYIPQRRDFGRMGFIRKDWLDRVGMAVPTTLKEYEEVLRAFKKMDANGNGDPDDEIPTSGRKDARWMDHLFVPFYVALDEGKPMFHEYGGELVFSAVTPNMKEALEWISGLYREGLLDPESLVNSRQTWKGKINSDRVGSWYYIGETANADFLLVEDQNPEAEFVYLPPLKAEGYDVSVYWVKDYRGSWLALAAMSEDRAVKALQLLNYVSDPEYVKRISGGLVGFDAQLSKTGEIIPMARNNAMPKPLTGLEFHASIENRTYPLQIVMERGGSDAEKEAAKAAYDIVMASSHTPIAGCALPSTIFEGYPDIKSNQLYIEYASKIIIGEWPIEKFDEFVTRWYESGGEEVTRRAREVYSKLQP